MARRKKGSKMEIQGRVLYESYFNEVHEIAHDLGYIIINQSYWYPESKYTEQQAIEKYLNDRK